VKSSRYLAVAATAAVSFLTAGAVLAQAPPPDSARGPPRPALVLPPPLRLLLPPPLPPLGPRPAAGGRH
jgi:hypothetical protein